MHMVLQCYFFVWLHSHFLADSSNQFTHILQCYITGTGAILRLPQCQWSNPEGYRQTGRCPTTTKYDKAQSDFVTWWRHEMGTFCSSLALCEGNPPVTGGFPSQRPVTRSFAVFFDLRLQKRLSKPLRRQWFETPSRSSWRHCNQS